MTVKSTSHDRNHTRQPGRNGGLRQLVESLVCLALAVILVRAFEVEGYMISTGSMAPHLLGFHKRVICPSCEYRFAFGVAESQRPGGPVVKSTGEASGSPGRPSHYGKKLAACPNCGQEAIDVSRVRRNQGDQLLVNKHAYLLQSPRRWEVVVFRNPNRPTQAYVKRIVGLPGETVQIRDGDVYIDGRLQRKPLPIQRAVRVLVYNHDHRPADDPNWQPRWLPVRNDRGPNEPQWQRMGSSFVLDVSSTRGDSPAPRERHSEWAWVTYRHWTRDGRVKPISDTYGYNEPAEVRSSVPIRDLMLTAEVTIQRGDGEFVVRMTDGRQLFDCVIDAGREEARLLVAGMFGHGPPSPPREKPPMPSTAIQGSARSVRSARLPRETLQQPFRLEMSLMDRQVTVGINGGPVFDAWEIPETFAEQSAPAAAGGSRPLSPKGTAESNPSMSPVRFGARGLTVTVDSLKLYRDIYYRSRSPLTARNGIDRPFPLGDDEYFVLGDNSPVSSDSRCWPHGAVPEHLLLGKPFIVHLPSRPGKIRIGGWTAHIRVPDPSRIRYIR